MEFHARLHAEGGSLLTHELRMSLNLCQCRLPQVDVKSPAALRLITRPCELQAILLENDLDSSAVKMVPLRRKRGLSVQLRMAHPTQEQIEAYQRVVSQGRV